MPAPWEAALTETAVVWDFDSWDKRGKVVVADVPRQIDCRWEDGETASGPPNRDQVTVDAQLITSELLITGSKVWRGSMEDLHNGRFEEKANPLMVVVTARRIPDERGEDAAYTAGLTRSKDRLPTTA